MISLQNHIVDLLVNNLGIKRTDLYNLSGIENKRDFLNEMNRLLAERRIIEEYCIEYSRARYSPRVVYIYEYKKEAELEHIEYQIGFIPLDVLEKDLEYVNNGTEQEDCLDFELQITGYQIKPKHKSYFENHTGMSFDLEKNNYYLWSKYLYPC
jgi:hypothetical protein